MQDIGLQVNLDKLRWLFTNPDKFHPQRTIAQTLNSLRNNWLNPPEWVDWLRTAEEEKAGYPLRPVAKADFAGELKKCTLTHLYNALAGWTMCTSG